MKISKIIVFDLIVCFLFFPVFHLVLNSYFNVPQFGNKATSMAMAFYYGFLSLPLIFIKIALTILTNFLFYKKTIILIVNFLYCSFFTLLTYPGISNSPIFNFDDSWLNFGITFMIFNIFIYMLYSWSFIKSNFIK